MEEKCAPKTTSTTWTKSPTVLRTGDAQCRILLQSVQNSGQGHFGLFSLMQPGAMSLKVKVLPDEQMHVPGTGLVGVDRLRIRDSS